MGGLGRALLSNWWLKLLSLGLAYGLWALVTQAPPMDVEVSVPLELRNLAPDLQVAGGLTTRARLHLRGSESLLHELGSNNLELVVDLEGFGAGHHRFRLTAQNAEVPLGIEVVGVSPEEVWLELVPAGAASAP